MKETLHFLLSHIVTHTDDIQIDESTQDERIILTVHVHPEDMGQVIGKHGRIIRALRDLIKLIAAKQNVFADVVIAE